MHAQIITFTLTDLDEDGYHTAGAEMAPGFAKLPGLLAKIWLADPTANTYGGVYLWRDGESMRGYLASELFATVAASPHFTDINSRDFTVYHDLTTITQPGIQVLETAGFRAKPPPCIRLDDTRLSPPAARRG